MDAILLAERSVKRALSKGCDGAEVFIRTAKRLSVEAKNNSVDALNSSKDFGISLRVIKKHRLGFSFTTDPEKLEDMIEGAVKSAEFTAEDEYVEIPEHKPSSEVLVFDEKIKNISEDDVIKNALLLEKAALDFDRRIKKVRKAAVSMATASTTILNSKGVKASYESSFITSSVLALAEDGHDIQTGWDFAISRRLSDIDFISVAEAASKKAIDLLGSRKITSVKVPVILRSSVAVDFLSIFSASLSAEAVQKKRSFLAGKVGKNIINPLATIIDDGLIPWKIGTKPVDDEGVPTSRKLIVSEGILNGFIHNTYTAKKDGVASTGNAVRGNFKSLPGVDVTNLYIEPEESQKSEVGSEKLEALTPLSIPPLLRGDTEGLKGDLRGVREQGLERENGNLIKSVSKGILVLEAMGVHTANPVSGDFSVGISGIWIENGEISYPIKEAVMSGNVLELFKRIERVGGDLRFYGKVGSPSLLIGEMDISA